MKYCNKLDWGVCAVAIVRENYFWIRDWVEHHLDAGASLVVLYDNTGSTGSDRPNTVFTLGKLQASGMTKRGENYQGATKHIPDDRIQCELEEMVREFDGRFLVRKWQPVGKNGKIVHGQAEAYADFCRRYRDTLEWAVFLDCDEYLYLEPGRTVAGLVESVPSDVSMIHLHQHRMPSRWLFPSVDVGKIRGAVPRETDRSFPKSFARLRDVQGTNVHVDWRYRGRPVTVDKYVMGFCHYREQISACIRFDIDPRAFLAFESHPMPPVRLVPANVKMFDEKVIPISV